MGKRKSSYKMEKERSCDGKRKQNKNKNNFEKERENFKKRGHKNHFPCLSTRWHLGESSTRVLYW